MPAIKRVVGVFLTVLLAVSLSALLAPSANAAPYTTTPAIGVNDTCPDTGGTITVTGTNYAPNEIVTLILNSDPVLLGSVQASAVGGFTKVVQLPAGVTGTHNIEGNGATGTTASTQIKIACVVTGPGGGPGGLPVTGVAIFGIGIVSLLLLVAGSTLLIGARRRSGTTV